MPNTTVDPMKSTTIIPVHSFIDLITNSSTEIFVSANTGAIKTIKQLVENLLTIGGGTLTADQVFKFETVYACEHDYDEVFMSKDEMKAKKAELKAKLEKAAKKTDEDIPSDEDDSDDPEDRDEFEKLGWKFWDKDDEQTTIAVRVTALVTDDSTAVKAAKILSDLDSLFTYEEKYNG